MEFKNPSEKKSSSTKVSHIECLMLLAKTVDKTLVIIITLDPVPMINLLVKLDQILLAWNSGGVMQWLVRKCYTAVTMHFLYYFKHRRLC